MSRSGVSNVQIQHLRIHYTEKHRLFGVSAQTPYHPPLGPFRPSPPNMFTLEPLSKMCITVQGKS
jgi:hypothetical protein